MCHCIRDIDARLAGSNARIAVGFTFSETRMNLAPPMIALEKIDKKKRGQPPVLLASFCPFCGEKLRA